MSKKKPNRAVEDAGDDLPVSDAPLASDAPPPDPYAETSEEEEASTLPMTATDSLGGTVVPVGNVANTPSPDAPGQINVGEGNTVAATPRDPAAEPIEVADSVLANADGPAEPQMLAGVTRVSPDLKTQLEALQGGDLTVEEFSKRLQLAESAKSYLDYLSSYGYVTRTWRNSKGRYGLTEKGREALAGC